MKTTRFLAIGLLLTSLCNAQESRKTVYSPPQIKTFETGEQEIEVQQVLPSPESGTFYSIQLTNFPPLPLNPFPEFPVYFWSEGIFLFDDENVDYVALKEQNISLFGTANYDVKPKDSAPLAMADAPAPPGGTGTNGWPTNSFPDAFAYTNGLWLDIYSHDSNWMTLELHGTVEDEFYQILTKTNLSESSWTINHGFIGLSNLTVATPISVIGRSNLFFLARNSGQDEDGDGLPDWWEAENSLDPTIFDTGDAGTSDGYKDGDNDGWSNLEEFENATSPSAFNTPPAPRGLIVSLNSGGTVANLSWNRSGGAVTSYTIERAYLETGIDSFSVAATAQTFADTSPPAHSGSDYYPPVEYFPPAYRVRANYAAGNSAWSPHVSVHRSRGAASFWFVRGENGNFYLVSSALSSDVVALKVTGIEYSFVSDPETNIFTISSTNFVNGVAVIPTAQIPFGYAGTFWVQTASADGKWSRYFFAGSAFEKSIPFFDGREQLKQNLSFLLRGADMELPFDYYLDDLLIETTANYAYASYYQLSPFFLYAIPHEFQPFKENYRYRNFAFSANGPLTNGIVGIEDGLPLLDESLIAHEFQLPSSVISISAILSSNVSERIYHSYFTDRFGLIEQWDENIGLTNYHFNSNPKNIFGLNFLSASVHIGYPTNFFELYPGDNFTNLIDYCYVKVAQPQLRTVDYYFGRPDIDPLPGSGAFSPTNTTPLMIISGNYPGASFAGYAKQSLDNGDTNKFAYLGLYFDKAYKMNLNGTISTNESGILSEYGEFFPTQPGRVALTTKPESVGGTNIGGCIVDVIKLELDVNHDGIIDPLITGRDNTSYQKPFVFWINNDLDFNGKDVYSKDTNLVDSKAGFMASARGLEDFARLWISGVPSLPASEGYSVNLSWASDSGPTLNLYHSFETNGGMSYLTNAAMASNILNSTESSVAIETISSSTSCTFPANYFDGTRKHFLFEGVTEGEGDLILTISKNGQLIASTSVSIQLKNVKDMYEQVFIENVTTEFPAMRTSTATSTFRTNALAPSVYEAKQVIVALHGFNNTEWQAKSYAQTMFKRLYWNGYEGRFAALRWPTLTGFLNYNRSEYIAFRSAPGASAYFNSLRSRFPDYSINVAAHSMGNIVMMETLKLQLAASSNAINNYVLMEAAVPAHCYDTNAALCPGLFTSESPPQTPNTYLGYPGAITNALRGKMFNFFNTNDFALKSWVGNQLLKKPDGGSGYIVDPNLQPYFLPNTLITDSREIMAFCARPRSFAVGAQPDVEGMIHGTEVDMHIQFGFEDGVADHSGQFTRNIQQLRSFYTTLLQKFSED